MTMPAFGSEPPPNPQAGAAYRVIFERYVPHYCATRERRDFIAAELKAVTEWAASQSPEVRKAYKWAVEYIMRDVDARMEQYDRAHKVEAALRTIPRPPEPEQTGG